MDWLVDYLVGTEGGFSCRQFWSPESAWHEQREWPPEMEKPGPPGILLVDRRDVDLGWFWRTGSSKQSPGLPDWIRGIISLDNYAEPPSDPVDKPFRTFQTLPHPTWGEPPNSGDWSGKGRGVDSPAPLSGSPGVDLFPGGLLVNPVLFSRDGGYPAEKKWSALVYLGGLSLEQALDCLSNTSPAARPLPGPVALVLPAGKKISEITTDPFLTAGRRIFGRSPVLLESELSRQGNAGFLEELRATRLLIGYTGLTLLEGFLLGAEIRQLPITEYHQQVGLAWSQVFSWSEPSWDWDLGTDSVPGTDLGQESGPGGALPESQRKSWREMLAKARPAWAEQLRKFWNKWGRTPVQY